MMNAGREPNPMAQVGSREHAEAVTWGRHLGVADALQWLTFSHLPEQLQKYSRPFYEAAVEILNQVRLDSPELTTTLNNLVWAKDSGVRAGIKADTGRAGSVPRPQTVVNPPLFDQSQTPPPIAPPGGWGR